MNIILPPFMRKIANNSRFSSRKFMNAWYRHYKSLFFLLFLLALGWGAYIWYFSIYEYHWNEAQKKAYLEKYFQETTLKEKEFHSLVESIREQERKHREPIKLEKNIFE